MTTTIWTTLVIRLNMTRSASRRLLFPMLLVCLGLVMALCTPSSAATLTLVRDHQPQAVLVLPTNPTKLETQASEELRDDIKRISGAELPAVSVGEDRHGKTPIFIGRAADEALLDQVRAQGDNPASFILKVSKDAVAIRGLSDRGTLFGAYELLEQLGVRWYMPGEIGTVIPNKATLTIDQQTKIEHPGFIGRHLQAIAAPIWAQHMRMGGLDAGGHGLGPRVNRKTHPELFIHVDGKPTNQLDVTNPKVLDIVVDYWLKKLKDHPELRDTYLSIGPKDGGGFGHTAWDSKDIAPLHGRTSVTDRYIKFFNIVLDRLQKKYPKVGISFYAYALYMRPPVNVKPNPRILPVFAPIDLCRIHTIKSPNCWERQYMGELIAGWQKLGLNIMYRGYYFNLCNPGIPYCPTTQVATELRYFYKHGVIACRVETMPAWAYIGPSLYLAAKMMWDPTLDAKALLDEYYTKFYGPAAEPMRNYFQTLDHAYVSSDYHTGNVFDVPHILTKQVLAELDQALDQAQRAAPADSVYAKRVAMVCTGQHAGELILAAMDAFDHTNFDAAKHDTDIIRPILIAGLKHTPPLFHKSVGIGYFNRFWGDNIDNGYARTHNGNEKVLQLPDEWYFMLDPYQGGVQMGLWKPTLGTQSWRKLRTYSESWSDQGLRYYASDAWYRTKFQVPVKYRGRKLIFWFGGVDNSAEVWVNGQKIPMIAKGASPIGRPWEYDATDAIRFGDQENVIAVLVHTHVLREIGTGGLTGPVMLYAKKK